MLNILIATTNPGKFHEFVSEYSDLPIKFVSLRDLKLDKIDLEEPHDTLWENALHKAKFFAKKSGLTTIAEDTGFYVKHLGGEPGIAPHRYAPTGPERNQKVLKNLVSVPRAKRGTYFQTDACLYDPTKDSFTIFTGKVKGFITEKLIGRERDGMDYDAIFYYPPLKKNFSELSILEKNNVSHRGQIIHQIKYFLSKQLALRHIVVSVGIVVKNRRMLVTKRRDNRPEFDGRWEFPGGAVEDGEEVDECLVREMKEETGYQVKILEQLPRIIMRCESKYNYQVFLIGYVCKPISGKLKLLDHESSDAAWLSLKDCQTTKFLPLNKRYIRWHLKKLKKYIDL